MHGHYSRKYLLVASGGLAGGGPGGCGGGLARDQARSSRLAEDLFSCSRRRFVFHAFPFAWCLRACRSDRHHPSVVGVAVGHQRGSTFSPGFRASGMAHSVIFFLGCWHVDSPSLSEATCQLTRWCSGRGIRVAVCDSDVSGPAPLTIVVRRGFQSVKTSGKKCLALVAGATVLVAIAALCWPEILYRRALPKYRLGITAEALQRELGVRFRLRKNGNYLHDEATDIEKRRHFSYDATVPRDYVELEFNDFHELIAITKRTPLSRCGFRERTLHNVFEKPRALSSGQDIQRASSNVTHIVLEGLSEKDFPELAKFSDLYEIDFKGGATDEQLQALSRIGCSNVAQVVFIDCHRLTDKGVDCLTNIPSIRGLYLLGTSITDAGCQTIGAKMKLTLIDLTDCPKVTVNGLAMLASSETLKELRFSLNDLTQDELVQILTSARNVKCVEIDIAGSADANLDRSALRKLAADKHITLLQKRGDTVSGL